uniref:Uncharacterized protein n=1 Tax=Mola mola TaxID=94237 RepID=A0A3Q3WAY3_MOLML
MHTTVQHNEQGKLFQKTNNLLILQSSNNCLQQANSGSPGNSGKFMQLDLRDDGPFFFKNLSLRHVLIGPEREGIGPVLIRAIKEVPSVTGKKDGKFTSEPRAVLHSLSKRAGGSIFDLSCMQSRRGEGRATEGSRLKQTKKILLIFTLSGTNPI